MKVIDSHCHLSWESFDNDLEEVIERNKKELYAVITIGVDLEDNKKTLGIAERYKPFVYCALGQAPAWKYENPELIIEQIRENKDKIVGIGEVGLDYHWAKEDKKREWQKDAFKRYISLADELSLPLIVHTRKAMEDTLSILEHNAPDKVVIHCFSGNSADAKRCVDNGFFISFATNALRGNYNNLIKKLPLEYILVETDSPFLSPVKGMRNEPYFCKKTIELIASLQDIPLEECSDVIFQNTLRCFDL
ncbi:MAG: TatD family hydrolase [Candidatus Diapherotrites archaeon]|nr:TatD family hydrolase [Candidatus Diapherotrites archaeon]